MLDLADLAPADREKGTAAVQAVTLREIRGGRDFEAAYALLASFFASRGELEPREVLAGFASSGTAPTQPGVVTSYHLVGAWDGAELVGVRDCYVDIDVANGRCLVSLAHALVVPRWRRRGLAAVLRTLPVSMVRRRSQELAGRELPALVVAEMEPHDPSDPDTLVRLVAYGRSGFRALDPSRVPYSQPVLDGSGGAIPLLGVVRTLGLHGDTVPTELVAWFPTLFHLTHAAYLSDVCVAPSRDHALGTLARSQDPVPLLPLPSHPADVAALAPLARDLVEACYPLALRRAPASSAGVTGS